MKHDYKSNKVIKDENYYFELGSDFIKSGKYQESINAYKQAIKIKPDYAKAHLNLGHAYEKVGNYLEAKDAYKQAIRIKSDYADAHLNLALTYLILGDKDSALDEYKILKDLDNESYKKASIHILKMQSDDNKRTVKPERNLTSETEPNNLLIKREKVLQESEKPDNEIKLLKTNKNIENNEKNPRKAKLSSTESASLPALIPALRIEGPLYFCEEEVPLNNQEVRERLEKELLLTLWDRAQVILWIKRSGRYMPVIEKILREAGLPDDLKYLAVIESALLAHIRSSKGATGFWQFIKKTGQRFGLTINRDKDERLNIFSSTKAASLYLKELYEMFGSWSLASAAYNYGEDRLINAMERQEVNDYYRLYLPRETQRYLFKIVAAKMVLSNPDKYGFHVQEDDLYPPVEFDKVTVTCSIQIPLQLVAKAASTYYKLIRDLNPELRSQYLPKGEHTLAIPKGSADKFQTRYTRLITEWEEENRIRLYTVKKGDNLSLIADKFDVPLDSLLRWNNVNSQENIYPGKELIVYQ